ncbi:HamA C-terminal domain-containing protein [Methylobacterium sp. P31]
MEPLPVVPKIFYKQNVNDNAKGADSVHIVINNNDFTLWFGEAKFYNSIADARLGAVVNSVYDALNTKKLDKERSIITNVKDLDTLCMDPLLRDKIKAALKPSKSIDHLKGRLNVPILLLHECSITSSGIDMSDKYCQSIIDFHTDRATSYFEKQLSKSQSVHKYELIRFHIILFPVPQKADLVKSFLKHVALYRED